MLVVVWFCTGWEIMSVKIKFNSVEDEEKAFELVLDELKTADNPHGFAYLGNKIFEVDNVSGFDQLHIGYKIIE